jgi:8-amino-7-oxononanoate synthase
MEYRLRLLSGNYPLIEEVEKELAVFHEADTALLFNSGYDANMGVISSIPQRGDTIIYDQLCHASIRDGIVYLLDSLIPLRTMILITWREK